MDNLKLGQHVRVTHKLIRQVRNEPGNASGLFPRHVISSREMKRWVPVKLVKPIDGIVVGKRNIADGERLWEGEEIGYIFITEEHKTAYMIAFDLHRNPIKALPEHVTARLIFEVEK